MFGQRHLQLAKPFDLVFGHLQKQWFQERYLIVKLQSTQTLWHSPCYRAVEPALAEHGHEFGQILKSLTPVPCELTADLIMNILNIGFGLTEKEQLSDKLKLTMINIRPPSFCKRLKSSFDDEKFLCGTGRWFNSTVRRDSCSGDSGGPLVAKVLNERNQEKFTLVGIVSYGDGKFHSCGSFGAYTKVSKYLNFIRDPIHNYWFTVLWLAAYLSLLLILLVPVQNIKCKKLFEKPEKSINNFVGISFGERFLWYWWSTSIFAFMSFVSVSTGVSYGVIFNKNIPAVKKLFPSSTTKPELT